MKSRDFCFWLQGYFELTNEGDGGEGLTEGQSQMIQRHLSLVFLHEIDPSQGSSEHQADLQEMHDGPERPGGIGGVNADGERMRC